MIVLIILTLLAIIVIYKTLQNRERYQNVPNYEIPADSYKTRHAGDCGNCNFIQDGKRYCNYRLLDIK